MGRPRSVDDEEVFRAVADVVSDVGPGGLTFAAVGERVGLSAPALAQRFGSKRGLLVAFSASAASAVDQLVEEVAGTTDDPLDALEKTLIALTSPVRSRAAMANNLAFLQLDLTDDELGKHATAQSRALRRRLTALVSEAMARGQLAPGDAEELADTIYTTYNGALLTWAIDGRGSVPKWLTARLDRVLRPYRTSAPSGR